MVIFLLTFWATGAPYPFILGAFETRAACDVRAALLYQPFTSGFAVCQSIVVEG